MRRDFSKMNRINRRLEATARGLGPQAPRRLSSRCALAFILLCASGAWERRAAADETLEQQPADVDPMPTVQDLDGVYFLLGPVASAVYSSDDWDGGIGGEVLLVRVQERRTIAGYGLGAGAIRLVEGDKGRLWADAMVGTKRLFDVGLGLSAGVTAEVGDTQAARLGWQATVWGYAGVIPYLRVGQVRTSGTFVDAGIKIALPAFRWR